MTGMDVLMRCQGYEEDMRRMDAALTRMRDARSRLSGGEEGKQQALALAAQEARLTAAREARREAHDMELVEALRLVGEVDSEDVGAVLYSLYVEGEKRASIALARHASEASIRGACRRGRRIMEKIPTKLSSSARYAQLRRTEKEAR